MTISYTGIVHHPQFLTQASRHNPMVLGVMKQIKPDDDNSPLPAKCFQPRVMRHASATADKEFAINDVYIANGSVVGFTEHARSPRFADVAELRRWIRERVESRSDAVCGDLGYTHGIEHFDTWLRAVDQPVIDYNQEIDE